VFRQIHHWAALVMTGAVVFHATRVFFTGAFRRPRELNWVLGVTLLLLTIGIGFAGYSLPDDLLSGTGLRIAYSIALSVPLVGTWLAFLVFGGEYPAPDILNRLFILHVMILPAAIAIVMGAHLAILWRQKHTNFPGRGLQEDQIRGPRVWPRYAFASGGLFFVLFGVMSLMGGNAQINPIWLYGPYDPITASGASQPDWYLGFTEGAIRLFPGWEIRMFGHELAEPFFPGVVLPGIVFGAMFLWPWIERIFTRDKAEHNLLQYPRDVPWRTAVGAATITFLAVLTLAGGSDVLASLLDLSVERVTGILRGVVIALPIVVLFVTYYVCRELRAGDVHPLRESKITTVRRRADGGFDTTEEEGGGFESAEERLGL
jgi:ubiquinol-cytochrome c reductase cytochrome b subunit